MYIINAFPETLLNPIASQSIVKVQNLDSIDVVTFFRTTLMDILHIYFSRRVGTCSHFVTASNIFAIIPFVFGNNTLTL